MRRHRLKKGLKNKFKNLSFFKKNLLVMMASLVLVCFTMVGYAALNQTLNITGDLIIRADKDIRITDLKLVGTPTNAYEQYNSKYTVDTISVFPAFESGNGSISYQATITNKGSTDMEITGINKELSDSSINCSIIGLYKETIIEAGSTKTFTITLTGSNTVTSDALGVGLLLEITWDEYYEKYLTYNISGNSIQNGTPTTSNPVAIESVGDKTSNLFNINGGIEQISYGSLTLIDGENIVIDYSSSNNISAEFAQFIPVEENEIYNVSFDLVQGGSRILIRMYDENKTIIDENLSITGFTYLSGYQGIYANTNNINVSFPSRVKYIRFCTVAMNTQKDTDNIYTNFQFSKGTTKKEYEPYGKYKIPIEASGKNLLNIDDSVNGTVLKDNNDGTYDLVLTSGGRFTSYVDFYIPANTTFTISLEILEYTGELPQAFNVRYKLADGSLYYSNFRTTNSSMKHTFESDVVQIQFYAPGGNSVDSYARFRNLQIELGDTATEYVPYVEPTIKNIYLDEPLRKVDEYIDYIDFTNNKLVRNTNFLNLQGITWYEQNGDNKFYYINSQSVPIKPISSSAKYSKSNVFNGIYISLDSTSIGINAYTSGIIRVRPDLSVFDTLEKWQEYVDNNEFYIIYPTSSRVETIELPEIIKKPFYTNVKVNTSVQPSEIDYSYVAK